MPKHTDFELHTDRFEFEATVCQFRESWWPSAEWRNGSGDVFVPLPGDRCLWLSLFVPSQFALADAEGLPTPDPPHECAVDGCDYVTDSYGAFLAHDQRKHHPDD